MMQSSVVGGAQSSVVGDDAVLHGWQRVAMGSLLSSEGPEFHSCFFPTGELITNTLSSFVNLSSYLDEVLSYFSPNPLLSTFALLGIICLYKNMQAPMHT